MMRITLTIVVMAFLLSACSSMSKSECRNANWRMIGYEDGAAGRPASRIGERRKACADHDVVPDFQAYRDGHTEGLRDYCTPARGFDFGRRGGNYTGICPADLEAGFLDAYGIGREHYAVISELNYYDSEIRKCKARIKKLRHRVKDNAVYIISDEATREERAASLVDIADDNATIGELEAKIVEYERLRTISQVEYEHLEAPVFH